MKIVDARGKPCPEPVVMVKAALEQGEIELEVLLDNPVSASNVMRYLDGKGYEAQLLEAAEALTVTGTKREIVSAAQESPLAAPPASFPPVGEEPFSVLIAARHLGRDDAELGEVLMKSFLGTLGQTEGCFVVALMNEGVKLALSDSSCCEYLQALQGRGTAVLVCGTCVNHFGLGDRIGVGTISNMFEILESLRKAPKVISL